MPELVTKDEGGINSVNYSGLIPYLIEAIKELEIKNNILQIELNALKQIINK